MSKQRMIDELEEIVRMYANSQDSYHRGVYEVLYRPLYELDDEEHRKTFENTVMIKALRKVVE